VDANAMQEQGFTALNLAMAEKHMALIELLKSAEAQR
jgi:hypothetical protein